MTALSLHLSDKLAKASHEAAKAMGISRTEFIRQALTHELENFYTDQERQAIARCFSAMRKNKRYIIQSKKLETDFGDTELPDEKDEWWTGKK